MRHRTSVLASFIVLFSAAACSEVDVVPGGPSGPGSEDPADPGGDTSAPQAPPVVEGVPIDPELTESFGVFVVEGGAPDAEGTRMSPLGTISSGLARAKELGKRV